MVKSRRRNSRSKSRRKPCKSNQVRNRSTGRCRKVSRRRSRSRRKSLPRKYQGSCKYGRRKDGYCKKKSRSRRKPRGKSRGKSRGPCKPGKARSSKTGRCASIRSRSKAAIERASCRKQGLVYDPKSDPKCRRKRSPASKKRKVSAKARKGAKANWGKLRSATANKIVARRKAAQKLQSLARTRINRRKRDDMLRAQSDVA